MLELNNKQYFGRVSHAKEAKTNKEFNYYFNRYLDKNYVFLELVNRIINLINSNKDFEVILRTKKNSSKNIYLDTR